MQRAINEYTEEPLLAIIPGVALEQLWSLVGIADQALMLIAAFVVLAGLLGMLTTILTSLNKMPAAVRRCSSCPVADRRQRCRSRESPRCGNARPRSIESTRLAPRTPLAASARVNGLTKNR